MVEMHADRDVGVDLDQRVDQLGQHDVIGIGARAAARLQDDRRFGLFGRLHDGEALFHVVHVEGGHAIAVFGGVIEQLSQCDASQRIVSRIWFQTCGCGLSAHRPAPDASGRISAQPQP